ncbi:MAG: hypothetical protein H7308_04745, partial [Chthonomonadaceae bacterium]|nr:hypothetical protein [Chthonomonadaceae bacterium]
MLSVKKKGGTASKRQLPKEKTRRNFPPPSLRYLKDCLCGSHNYWIARKSNYRRIELMKTRTTVIGTLVGTLALAGATFGFTMSG